MFENVEQFNNHPPDTVQISVSKFKVPLACGTRFGDDDKLKATTEAWFGDNFKGRDCLKEEGQIP